MRVGRYEVTGHVGQGGMGTVVRARDSSGRDLAIKVIRNSASPDAAARFERERRLLESLGKAEGFVPLLDAGEGPTGPYLVMPYVAGGTLRACFERGPLAVEDAVLLVKKLATAIGRAHERGVVHRDLKPENILLEDGDPRLPLITDLGLAKHFDRGTPGASLSVTLSRGGDARGTAGYMAPEQLTSEQVDARADVFALGAILYEALAGAPPFEGETLVQLISKVERGAVTPIESRRSEVPDWLGSIVARALDPEPSRRYADGKDLAAALAERRTEQTRRGPVAWLVLAALLVVLGMGIALVVHALRVEPRVAVAPPPRPPGPAPVTPVPAKDAPEWWLAQSEDERPPLPLPKGLSFGERRGEYVWARDGSVLVYVPAGVFRMGSVEFPELQSEGPVHEVELSAYFVGKLEVTTAQFEKFVLATGHTTEASKHGSDWRRPGDEPARPEHPVVCVTWRDARAYATWAGLRLPTEAQWERAAAWDARKRVARRFAWGEVSAGPRLAALGNVADEALLRVLPTVPDTFRGVDDGFALVAPVGRFPEGASPVGALDMTGNAFEWCADGFEEDYYRKSPKKDPYRSPDGVLSRALRGGSFKTEWWRSRAAYRGCPPADEATDYIGFRIALPGR